MSYLAGLRLDTLRALLCGSGASILLLTPLSRVEFGESC
jgi:hypothetical protein